MKCIISLVVVGSLLDCAVTDEFALFREEMESKVIWIVNNMTHAYQQRCSQGVRNCHTKSYNLCEGTGQRQCLQEYPTPENCASNGIYFSRYSGVRLPHNNTLNQKQKQSVCLLTSLNPTFQQIHSQNNNRHSFAFFGASTGIISLLPSFMEEQVSNKCYDYDPRKRPWYASAISGGKNIIIYIDTSLSMQGQRINHVKQALQIIISTLSYHDFIAIIQFNEEARVIGSMKSIGRAYSSIKQNLLEEVGKLQARGQTNYQKALRLGFSLLQQSYQQQSLSPCSEVVFLFLTDGPPTQGYSTFPQFQTLIDAELQKLQNMQLTFMFYSMNYNGSILQELSCKYNGMTFLQNDDDSLMDKFENYFTYLADGANTRYPIWSEPYIDAFGLGEVVTISMPAYFSDPNNRTIIIGVAAIDVVFSQLLNYQKSRDEVLDIILKEKGCFKSLSECKLESLRYRENPDFICNHICSNISSTQECEEDIVVDVFEEPMVTEKRHHSCCGLTIQQRTLVLAIVFGVIGFALIGVMAIYGVRRLLSNYTLRHIREQPAAQSLRRIIPEQIFETEQDIEYMYMKAKEHGIAIYPSSSFGQ